ncbi:MAG: allantoinase AllB [Spirochaetia bacterium]|jgi:allantoinase
MPFDLLIRGAYVVTAVGVDRLSIGIEEGKVAALVPEESGAARETIDARGLHVFPGVIDAHVHFNEPGRTEWEGVASGSAALSAGGGTCFIDMPLNSSPPTLDAPSFAAKLAAFKGAARTDFALWGGLTPDNIDHLEALAECGVVGFKAFMSGSGIEDFRRCDDDTLFRGMQIAARLGLPVAVHAENDGIVSALSASARAGGRTSVRDFLASRPLIAEAEAISRALLFAGETGCSLHVVHTSSARGAELVRAAVESGLCDATCETCPHYLLLCDSDVEELGARAKCAPPVRSAGERDKLVALVAAGRVDTIGSDHSPAPPEMKRSEDFFRAWGGISGVQSTLRALLTLDLPLPLAARLASVNVARRFRLPGKGGIRIGADADLALVDLSVTSALGVEELLDRHRASPYAGRTFRGVVRRTLVRGRTVCRDGVTVGAPTGQFLRPGRV